MATINNFTPMLKQRLEKAVNGLPPVLGTEAVNWVKDNFRRQGYPDKGGLQPWPPRAANSRRNKGRALLVGQPPGRLHRSPRILRRTGLRVDVGTDVPYAAAHNQGVNKVVTVAAHRRNKIGKVKVSTGKSGQKFRTKNAVVGRGNVRSHQRRMNLPRRQFIGASTILTSILRRRAIVHLGREMKR